ncbi:MAG: preprotein translocase subunit SecA, partial [Bacteroidales bacterium]|nr:preprotein translocase subunit SecA [Bacteroidales bacterium]
MSLASVIGKLFGSKAERDYKAIKPVLDKVLAVYPEIDSLSDDGIRQRSAALRERLREVEAPFEERIASIKLELEKDIPVSEKEKLAGESDKLVKEEDEAIEKCLDEILPEAFAIVKSTARRFAQNPVIEVTANDFDRDLAATHDFVRIEGDKAVWQNHWLAGGNEVTWDMVHYDVQLVGGIALHQGRIAEMATGEGKTLVATLPVFLNALAGKGVHMVTANDYLSKRDSEWMGPLYMFHGLSVDCIDKHQPNSDARKRAYDCDITFGTNNEFGFDYLRDNMAISAADLVQRKHHYAIVDEVDSVLIDDARTPLIISGPVGKVQGDEQFVEFKPYVEKLYLAQRALVNQVLNEAKKKISEGDETEGGKLLLRAHKGLPKYQPLIKYLSEPGTKVLLQKAENYYMQDNEKEMPVVTDPLYFVINEVLHSIQLTDKGQETLAAYVNNNDFFLLPDVGSQTAEIEHSDLSPAEKQEKKDALMEDFSLKSERVHTVSQLLKAYAMFEKDIDYVVIDENGVKKVKIVDESTGRIMEGRRWSDGLHQAVEAKENVKVEAATQTFATITLQNYFRMYHKLSGMTGTAET